MTLLYILIGIFIVGVFILLFRQESIQRFKDDIIVAEAYLKCPPSQLNYEYLRELFNQVTGLSYIDKERLDHDLMKFCDKYGEYIAKDFEDFTHQYRGFIKRHFIYFARLFPEKIVEVK